MSRPSDNRSLLILLSVLTFVVCGTYILVVFGKGYRLNFSNGPKFQATGLLSATSSPKSASVYLDDRLVTATDDTLNLVPGNYQVRIAKDGYLPWAKLVTIKKEIVSPVSAQLFRSAPNLKPVTFVGAINPTVSPDNTKIVFAVASASATKDNGLYLLEDQGYPLSFGHNTPKQIAPDFVGINWSHFSFIFAPDGKSILATSLKPAINYLIKLDSAITSGKLFDVTTQIPIIKEEWQTQQTTLINSQISRLPSSLQSAISTQSSSHLQFSPDESKILYLANKKINLSPILTVTPPSQNNLPQQRQIEPLKYYVYDLKNDTNYLIADNGQFSHLFWLPNSDNLILATTDTIYASDSDGSNRQTLFKGQFMALVLATSTNGLDLVTVISPYDSAPENLYAITIR
ncbi:MAG: PEGA domain-containing protein [Candidatus Shapirobacteria bacterium]|jgi:hypothetical protein